MNVVTHTEMHVARVDLTMSPSVLWCGQSRTRRLPDAVRANPRCTACTDQDAISRTRRKDAFLAADGQSLCSHRTLTRDTCHRTFSTPYAVRSTRARSETPSAHAVRDAIRHSDETLASLGTLASHRHSERFSWLACCPSLFPLFELPVGGGSSCVALHIEV